MIGGDRGRRWLCRYSPSPRWSAPAFQGCRCRPAGSFRPWSWCTYRRRSSRGWSRSLGLRRGPKPPAASRPPVRLQWIQDASEQLPAVVVESHGGDVGECDLSHQRYEAGNSWSESNFVLQRFPACQESLLTTIGCWCFVLLTLASLRNVTGGRCGNKPTKINPAGGIFTRIFFLHTKELEMVHLN